MENREEQGTKFKPVTPEDATRKEDLNRIRGMQQFKFDERGPQNPTPNPSNGEERHHVR